MRELRGQTLDVARFKQMTGLSRKYAIPLLEYLDRERVTRKDGDAAPGALTGCARCLVQRWLGHARMC